MEGEGEAVTAKNKNHVTRAVGEEGLVGDRLLAVLALRSPEAVLAGCC